MERRGFIQSLIGGITSAGLLLKASPAEIEAFGAAPGQAAILSAAPVVQPFTPVRAGDTLYDARGCAVAIVERVAAYGPEPIDITQFGDNTRKIYRPPCPITIRITAEGLPAARLQ